MGYVGSSLASVNSARAAESRKERLAIEKEMRDKAEKPLRDLTEKLSRSHGDYLLEQRNLQIVELRHRLTTQPSPNFTTAPYLCDGHDSAEDITRKITEAVTEWCKTGDPLPSFDDSKLVSAFVAMNWETADTTKPATFQKAWEYILGKFRELDLQFEAPEPVSVQHVTPDRYDSTRQEIADLRAKAEKCTFASKERDDLERRAYQLEVKLEVLGNDDYQSIMQEIVEQSGKALSSAHSLQFRQWLASPVQSRCYGTNPDRQETRFAFAAWADDTSFLNSAEKSELNRRANVAGMTSDDIVRAVGKRNDYGPRTVPGIRQEGQ